MIIILSIKPAVRGAMGCSQKSVKLVLAVPIAVIQFPSEWPLAPSVTSVT